MNKIKNYCKFIEKIDDAKQFCQFVKLLPSV